MAGFRLSRTKSNVKAYLKLSESSLELQKVDTVVIQLQKGCLCLQVCIHIIPVIANINKIHELLWMVVCVTAKRNGTNIGWQNTVSYTEGLQSPCGTQDHRWCRRVIVCQN